MQALKARQQRSAGSDCRGATIRARENAAEIFGGAITEVDLLTLVVVGLSMPVGIDWREETLARLSRKEVPVCD